MGILKYKEYEGTAELDMTRGVCRGKILFINDLVTYEATTPAELQKEFEVAVEDYLQTCAELGRSAKKPLKGLFNVRVSPKMHAQATLRALVDDVTLNDVVVKAMDCYLSGNINHNVQLTVTMQDSPMRAFASSASAPPNWETIANVH